MQTECKTNNVDVRVVKYPVDIGQGLKFFKTHTHSLPWIKSAPYLGCVLTHFYDIWM
jgi:hypothetical protein